MSADKKIKLLATMIMAITVEARSASFDVTVDQAAHAYKGLNEIQHLIANQLNAYLRPNGNIRPSPIFWQGLEELALRFHLRERLLSAIKWSLSRE